MIGSDSVCNATCVSWIMLLQRIEEHDSMIQTLSQRDDRDQYLPHITAMLGLRGHMYGELIRIQMMLAKDDPNMQVKLFTVFTCLSLVSILYILHANVAGIFHALISCAF